MGEDVVDVDSVKALIGVLSANDPAQPSLRFPLPEQEPGWLEAVELALALAGNTSVMSLELLAENGSNTSTLLVMLEALQQNATLRSFSFNAAGARVGDKTGLNLAQAVKRNTTIQSFKFSADATGMGDQTLKALDDAIQQCMLRNEDLRAQRQTLQQLARFDGNARFGSLTDRAFRDKVFEFFCPPGCKLRLRDDGRSLRSRDRFVAPPAPPD